MLCSSSDVRIFHIAVAWYQYEFNAVLFHGLNINIKPKRMQRGLVMSSLALHFFVCFVSSCCTMFKSSDIRTCLQGVVAWYHDESCAVLFHSLNHDQTKLHVLWAGTATPARLVLDLNERFLTPSYCTIAGPFSTFRM